MERVHPKLSLLISVDEDTDRGPAVVGVLTNHSLLRQFEMHPIELGPCKLFCVKMQQASFAVSLAEVK